MFLITIVSEKRKIKIYFMKAENQKNVLVNIQPNKKIQ